VVVDNGNTDEYLAATGGEWRPDQADWSGVEFSVTTSSTFGIVKAANNEPRFDHTSAGVCRGLLIEEGRTNLYQQSEVFNDSFWTKTRSSISSNATTAPDGTLTADKLVEDTTASNTHTISSAVTPPATAHTLSVFAKKGERTWIVLRLGGTNTFFNLDDGTIAAGSVNSPTITNFGNGWYRCAVTSSSGTQGQFWLATNSTTTSYTGDGTSGLFIWGAQLEAGSFPTSYIPTTTGTLARGADVCNITGGNFTSFYNQSEGTLFSNLSSESGFLGRAVTAVGSSSAEQVAIGRDVTRVRSGSVDIGSFYVNTTLLGKRAVAYAIDQQAASRLGGVVSSTNAGLPSGMSSLIIGGTIGVTTTVTVSAIRYYRKRLPNAKLQALTV
jgi:hypothetical protein